MGGSSFRSGPVSSETSFSVLPVYLNFVPQEKIDPPLTTGASDALGNLIRKECSVSDLLGCLIGFVGLRTFKQLYQGMSLRE